MNIFISRFSMVVSAMLVVVVCLYCLWMPKANSTELNVSLRESDTANISSVILSPSNTQPMKKGERAVEVSEYKLQYLKDVPPPQAFNMILVNRYVFYYHHADSVKESEESYLMRIMSDKYSRCHILVCDHEPSAGGNLQVIPKMPG
ncbi:hypothetical protein ACE38W_00560 [Chitinophaga sp. Hz27]|uniref:hypothetical protein n=1 Tax=Chitinophaga sp. Hz27 TaxID=3347169 RepID=UPI0035D8C683